MKNYRRYLCALSALLLLLSVGCTKPDNGDTNLQNETQHTTVGTVGEIPTTTTVAPTIAVPTTIPATVAPTTVPQEKTYQILYEDGKYSLQIPYSGSSYEEGTQVVKYGAEYETVSEMLHAIRTGDFEDWELRAMASDFSKDEKGNIKLFDMDNVVEAVYPDDLAFSHLLWTGDEYMFFVHNEDNQMHGAGIYIITQEGYQLYYDRYHTNRYDSDRITIYEEKQVEDRNAQVTYYKKIGSRPDYIFYERDVRYSYEEVDKSVIILEEYNDATCEYPDYVYILGEDNGTYFFCMISIDNEQRPDYEWLKQFGVKPYVENEDKV